MSSRRSLRCFGAVVALLVGLSAEGAGQEVHSPESMMRWLPTFLVLSEKLEYAPGGVDRPVILDVIAWMGGARNRLWVRAEAEQLTTGGGGEAQVEALYGRLVSPFFDALVGVRVDRHWGEGDSDARVLLSLGLEGMAPLWWELAPTLFVSQHGDISARLDASYGVLFTQRIVLEPKVEVNVAVQDVPEFGIGSGLSDIELGARLRYEVRRKFAPYVGVSWQRRLGQTAELARDALEPVGDFSWVAGLRLWY